MSPIENIERFPVVALAFAFLTLDIDVRQEMHLDLDQAVALAGLAPPALDVERKTARLVASGLGLGQAGEPIANGTEGAGVGRRVGARRAPDRRLVDIDDLVDEVEALDLVMGARIDARAVHALGDGLVERVDHQRRFTAARDAGDTGKRAERDARVDATKVVGAGADHDDFARFLTLAAGLGHGDFPGTR